MHFHALFFLTPMSDSTVKRRGMLVFKGSGTLPRAPLRKRPAVPDPSQGDSKSNSSVKGDGRIVCSGVTVQGMETRFKEQVTVGDILQIYHPQTLIQEERMVASILSQRSLTIASPFSSDFVSTIEYMIRKTPKESEISSDAPVKTEASTTSPHQVSQSNELLGNGDKILTYREKVGMSYRTVAVKVDQNMSKEDLLDLQTKKSHDRYC